MSCSPNPTPRQKLIAAARELIAQEGLAAAGIERILERAGVAKMTLYHHFASKEALVQEALEGYGQATRDRLIGVLEGGSSPREALLGLFDALDGVIRSPEYAGCPLARAALEHVLPDDPLHQVAVRHQRLLAERIQAVASRLGARDPRALTQVLMCLMDGVLLRAHVLADPELALLARRDAGLLIDASIEA